MGIGKFCTGRYDKWRRIPYRHFRRRLCQHRRDDSIIVVLENDHDDDDDDEDDGDPTSNLIISTGFRLPISRAFVMPQY